MRHFYRVLFTVKKGGERDYVFDVEAHNANEAKQNVRNYWKDHRVEAHLFRVRAKRVECGEYFSCPVQIDRYTCNRLHGELFGA